ncbi:lysozyme inhibitor LprI family protein [Virgibacillus sp. Bac332]|uniref:lysozyme inhibitor LprI family protein n=1 Tax=Virgibacillus sp. Bac332 TaxID=2419842 RepID=UPI000EF48713|nr:lysozyme inhibitor LprI family protein [Virgibacillus sp. Bac332]
MKRKFLLGMLTVVLVILTACGTSSDESTLENQSPNKNSSQNTNDDSASAASTDNDTNTNNTNTDTGSNGTDEKGDTTNNVPAKDTASLKDQYLKKLNDTKNEVEEMRKNPIDDTTYALKKVEGDAYDIWDELLNEIYGALKEQLPKEEMDQLRKEQREWIAYRDHTAKEASLKYKGGTMEQLEYVTVQNNLTEEKCFELVEDYMK